MRGRGGQLQPSLADRLWSRVDRSGGPEACWLWTGHVEGDGYGALKRPGARVSSRAHRIAFELTRGPIPDGMLLCHTCDVPRCCNPGHLFLGTNADNQRDMASKGRSTKGQFLGEAHPAARLSDAAVREIRQSAADQQTLAAKYGVDRSSISKILSGRTWRHVTIEGEA